MANNTQGTAHGSSGPSLARVIDLYEGHGKVFENVFPKDAELNDAFIAWAKGAFPHWYEEVEGSDPRSLALRLETLIYDEENEAESVAPFFVQLPAPLRDRALAALAAAGEGDD